MRHIFFWTLMVLLAGCAKQGPPPLTLEESPDAIVQAFKAARMQPKKNAEGIALLIKEKQYTAANIQLQALISNPELSEEQRSVLASTSIAVNEMLQTIAATAAPEMAPAEEPGAAPRPAAPQVSEDEAKAAAAAIQHYRMTK